MPFGTDQSVAMIIGSNPSNVAKRNSTRGCKEHAIRASLPQSELSSPGSPSGHDQNEASDEEMPVAIRV